MNKAVDTIREKLNSGETKPRIRRLILGVPYEEGSLEFCIETVARNLRASVNALVQYEGEEEASPARPIVGWAKDYPDAVLVPKTERVLVVEVDTAYRDRNDEISVALGELRSVLEKHERKPAVRYRLWKERRLQKKQVNSVPEEARRTRPSHG